jgi:hypothetical protein
MIQLGLWHLLFYKTGKQILKYVYLPPSVFKSMISWQEMVRLIRLRAAPFLTPENPWHKRLEPVFLNLSVRI